MTLNRALVLQDVSAALLAQGRPSEDSDGSCYYRHPHNPELRCGIGHLIPDDLYDSNIEDNTALALLKEGRLELDPKYGTPSPDDSLFLSTIQDIHDWHGSDDWKELFDDLAKSQ